jgi:hypothetical protein
MAGRFSITNMKENHRTSTALHREDICGFSATDMKGHRCEGVRQAAHWYGEQGGACVTHM